MSESEEAALIEFLHGQGYREMRRLPTGELAGIMKMIYTTGLMVGLTWESVRTRFCFETTDEALRSLEAWDGRGFPPGWWIKQKPEDVPNPRRAAA